MIKRVLFAVIFVVITALLAYIVSGFLAKNLYIPLFYLFQFAWVFIEAIPQAFWWGILLLTLLIVVFRNLRWEIGTRNVDSKRDSIATSRLEMWSNLIERSQKGEYSYWLFADRLSDFTLEILAHCERVNKEEVIEKMLDGKLDLPPVVEDFLRVGTEAPSFRHYTDLLIRSNQKRQDSALKTDIYAIVNFLESNF